MDKLRGKLVISLVFGVVVVLALSVFSDLPKMMAVLGHFKWLYLIPILGLTLFNYGLRFVKWHWYVRLIGARDVSKGDSLAIFLSGMTMAMTPGKVGELLKSYLLRQVAGTPISASAPIVVAERLTDGVAMICLASGGLALYQYGWQILLFVLVLALAVVAIAQYRTLALRIIAGAERLPLLAKRVHNLLTFYESSHELLKPRNLGLAVAIGFVSWGGECLAFYLVLTGLGFENTWLLLIQASFILAASTLIGSTSMLPGGLGVAEVGVTGMLLLLVQSPLMTRDSAVAATLLIRFCTLWFGVTLGIITLSLFGRRFSGKAAQVAADNELQQVSS
ncbi:MAG: flippase-like domain-containing protein [Chloroflexi bacterium]|nr:flippase-like domain-containing protein [Chloroflexota bacterium]